MSWLTIAQQQENHELSGLERDMRSHLEQSSRFYIRDTYCSIPNPMAGGKWQALLCDVDDGNVLDRSPEYATKNAAIKWASRNIPSSYYDGSIGAVDVELLTQ